MTIERVPLDRVDELIATAASCATPRASSACCWPAGSSMPDRDELARLLDEHDSWLAVERGLAANSLSAYRRDLRRYAEYLRSHGLSDAALVDESTVSAYVDHLKQARDDEGRPVRAVVDRPRARRGALVPPVLPRRRGFVDVDPSEEVGAPRVPRGSRRRSPRRRSTRCWARSIGDDPRVARPGDPRDALRHRCADQRAGRARPARPGLRRRAGAGAGQGRQGAGGADRPVGPRPRSRTTSRGPAAARAARSAPSRPGAIRSCSTPGAGGSPARGAGRSSRPRATGSGSAGGCRPTCCGTRARPTCSTTAPTSGWSRSCSATRACRPRRCTRRCRRSGSGRSTSWRIPGPGAEGFPQVGGRLAAWRRRPTQRCAPS